MPTVIEKLEQLIADELKALNTLFDGFPDNDLIIIELCKALDFYTIVPDDEKTKNRFKILERLQKSFPVLLEHAFKNIAFKNYFPQKASKELGVSNALDTLSFQIGELMTAKVLVDQAKAGLITIGESAFNLFSVSYSPVSSSLETIETMSYIEYFQRIERGLTNQREKHILKESDIRSIMKQLVEPSKTAFIRYNTTPEIDHYYSQLGYYELLSSEPYDLFAENALFGGIEYIQYVNVLMQLIGTGIKHIHYCYLLLEKHPEINLRDIACIQYELKKLIPQYAWYMQISAAKMEQIFSCLTATPDNISVHVKDHNSFSPTFIKVSENHVIRLVSGTINKPMLFLMRELKRQFPDDYHRNTEREGIFRTQLYYLFKTRQELTTNLLFVENAINIKSGGICTDIDAAIFDTRTQSLALFQLKWQDLYAHDAKERRSRLSNYSRKAEEWIEKMSDWIRLTDSQTILYTLRLIDKASYKKVRVEKVYLFVVNKWNGHFTNFLPDARAAWTSWYNLVVKMDEVSLSSKDYLQDLFLKLKEEVPELESIPSLIDNFELKFKNFTVAHKR